MSRVFSIPTALRVLPNDLLRRFFDGSISPLRLFLGALIPTLVAVVMFRVI